MRRAGSAVVVCAVLVWAGVNVARADGAAAGQAPPRAAASDVYKSVYDGWKWWHVYCFRCHGTNAVATTLAPDLIDPNRKTTR